MITFTFSLKKKISEKVDKTWKWDHKIDLFLFYLFPIKDICVAISVTQAGISKNIKYV